MITLAQFLKLNLTDSQRSGIGNQVGLLVGDILDGTIDDQNFARLIGQKDDSAIWLLWLCLHSSFFVRIIRIRSKQECSEPCSLVDFDKLPCRWSSRVLGAYFQSLTQQGAMIFSPYIAEDPPKLGIMEWLAVRLQERFHEEMLSANGFPSLDNTELPEELRLLFKKDSRYKTIFMNRWLWGVTELDVLSESIVPSLQKDILKAWIAKIDDAVLTSADLDILTTKYNNLKNLRMKSGIPLRLNQLKEQK